MSKFDAYSEYPNRGMAKAQAALLTIWPSLSHNLTESFTLSRGLSAGGWPRGRLSDEKFLGAYPVAVTMDADLGISLAAGGEIYGTISTDLAALGFKCDSESKSRYFSDVEGVRVYLDFLTEAEGADSGSRIVDDIIANVVPGINRALASRRGILVKGLDLYGAELNSRSISRELVRSLR